MRGVIVVSVTFSNFMHYYVECNYAESRCAEYRYAECQYAECRSA
jgi:hypothetical protein